jgi:hypothetical protein
MDVSSIMNVAGFESVKDPEVEAEENYQSGLFGITPAELKDAKRQETMDLMRMGQQVGLNNRTVGLGMLLGMGARKLMGKEDPREAKIEQASANREAFYEQLQGASNLEITKLGSKLLTADDDETRKFGMQLFSMGRAGTAAEAEAAKGKDYNPKAVNASDLSLATAAIKRSGYEVNSAQGLEVQNMIASEYKRLEELNKNTEAWQSLSPIEHYDSIYKSMIDNGTLTLGKGNFWYFGDAVQVGSSNIPAEGVPTATDNVRNENLAAAEAPYKNAASSFEQYGK